MKYSKDQKNIKMFTNEKDYEGLSLVSTLQKDKIINHMKVKKNCELLFSTS